MAVAATHTTESIGKCGLPQIRNKWSAKYNNGCPREINIDGFVFR